MKIGVLIIYLLSAVILIAIVIITLSYARKLRNRKDTQEGKVQMLDDAVAMMFSRTINVDLTHDTFTVKAPNSDMPVRMREGYDRNIVSVERMTIADDIQRDDYSNTFNRMALLEAFTRGEKNITRRYKLVSNDEIEKFMEINAVFVNDSTDGSVKAMLLCKEFETTVEHKILEHKLEQRDADVSKLTDQKRIMLERIAEQNVAIGKHVAESNELKKQVEASQEEARRVAEENQKLKDELEESNSKASNVDVAEMAKRFSRVATDFFIKSVAGDESVDIDLEKVVSSDKVEAFEEIEYIDAVTEDDIDMFNFKKSKKTETELNDEFKVEKSEVKDDLNNEVVMDKAPDFRNDTISISMLEEAIAAIKEKQANLEKAQGIYVEPEPEKDPETIPVEKETVVVADESILEEIIKEDAVAEEEIEAVSEATAALYEKHDEEIAKVNVEYDDEIAHYKNLVKSLDKKNSKLSRIIEEERHDHAKNLYQARSEYEEKLKMQGEVPEVKPVIKPVEKPETPKVEEIKPEPKAPLQPEPVVVPETIRPGHKKSAQAGNGKLIFEETGVVNLMLVMKEIVPMLQNMCESADVGLSVKFGDLKRPIVYADSLNLNAMILGLVNNASACARKNTTVVLSVNQVGIAKYGYADYEFACSYVGNKIDFDESVVQNMGGDFREVRNDDGSKAIVAKFRFEIR